jgi:hypothetical protein
VRAAIRGEYAPSARAINAFVDQRREMINAEEGMFRP